MSLKIESPFAYFPGADGLPLDNGAIYIGTSNLNPETNPIAVFFDEALTIPAAQPIRTSGGYAVRNGSPASIYTAADDFSITIRDSNGALVVSAPSATSVQNLQALLAAQSGSSLVGYIAAGSNKRARTIQDRARDRSPHLADYLGFDNTGNNSQTTILERAIADAAGAPVLTGPGSFVIDATVDYTTTSSDSFTQGLQIIGDGRLKTFFINEVANGPMLSVDTDTTNKFQVGVQLKNFGIKTITNPAASIAIQLRRAYHVELEQLAIDAGTGAGIKIVVNEGDGDGCNMVHLKHIRIDSRGTWGIDCELGSGLNELSFLGGEYVFIQSCGTTNAAYQPPSGGMRWKGQIMQLRNSAFTINNNCALWIPGDAGLSQNVDLQSVTFENNKGRNIFSRGIQGFKGRNIQQYHNDANVGTTGIEFEGDSFVVRNIDIDGCTVRATSGNNAFTAFKLSGVNTNFNTCRVKNVIWDNFDYTGQTRFNGWQFDQIQNDGMLQVPNGSEIYFRPNTNIGRGNKVPLRLRGGAGGAPSTSGEWVQHRLGSNGIFLSPTGMTASTRYYIYLYDNAGVATLEYSATAPTVDTTFGYSVKTGDATRFYCGSVIGGATDDTVLAASSGWLNPLIVPGPAVGVAGYLWLDNTGDLRAKYATAPTSDTDGTVVGTQT